VANRPRTISWPTTTAYTNDSLLTDLITTANTYSVQSANLDRQLGLATTVDAQSYALAAQHAQRLISYRLSELTNATFMIPPEAIQVTTDGSSELRRVYYTVTDSTTALSLTNYDLESLKDLATWNISAGETKRQRLRNNLRVLPRARTGIGAHVSPQELKARGTLRDMISENDWRRYVTNGFIMVKGASGRFYQLFADGRRTQVFHHGKNIATLCIHTDKSCPPSDHVLNLKILVELDEDAIWSGSNVSWLQKIA
jgi:hypothetical protein